MTREEAVKLIEVYGRAWETRDPDLITTIFTDDASYLDPREPLNQGKEAIRAYWVSKVVGEQDDVHFTLKNVWVDGDTVIAEWHADFVDTKRSLKVSLDEVAIFTVRDGKFVDNREYYTSVKTSL